jgi:hypothetical protein
MRSGKAARMAAPPTGQRFSNSARQSSSDSDIVGSGRVAKSTPSGAFRASDRRCAYRDFSSARVSASSGSCSAGTT